MRAKKTLVQSLLTLLFGFGFGEQPAAAQVQQSTAPSSQSVAPSTSPVIPDPGTTPPVVPHGAGDPFRGGTTPPQTPHGTSPSGGGTTAPRVPHGTSPPVPPQRVQWTIEEAVDRELASLEAEEERRRRELKLRFETRREALLADPDWRGLRRSERRRRLGELKREFAEQERSIEEEISARRQGARAAGRALERRGL